MRSAQLTPKTSRYPSDPIGLSAVAEVEILGDTSSSLRLCYFILFFLLSAKLSFACLRKHTTRVKNLVVIHMEIYAVQRYQI
jgi:hypothetical protein